MEREVRRQGDEAAPRAGVFGDKDERTHTRWLDADARDVIEAVADRSHRFVQLHDIGTMTDIHEIFAKGGAMEALLAARDQKIVRYLGITGHYRPDSLIEAIRRYPFDAILMAVNAADPHHYSF